MQNEIERDGSENEEAIKIVRKLNQSASVTRSRYS